MNNNIGCSTAAIPSPRRAFQTLSSEYHFPLPTKQRVEPDQIEYLRQLLVECQKSKERLNIQIVEKFIIDGVSQGKYPTWLFFLPKGLIESGIRGVQSGQTRLRSNNQKGAPFFFTAAWL